MKSIIAAVALFCAAGPAFAQVTLHVNVAWHDFAATAAAVDVDTANPNTGFYDHRTCFLALLDAFHGSCTVTFPDDDIELGNGLFFANTINLISPCDDSAWLPGLDAGGAVCGTAFNGDLVDAPAGTFVNFIDGNNTITVGAGQTADYNLEFSPSRG